jgi:hypothetical protein
MQNYYSGIKNINIPDGVRDMEWSLFIAIIMRSLEDITHCTELEGPKLMNFDESKYFFRKAGGLDQWLVIFGVRGDDKTWEIIRRKCWDIVLEKEEELLTKKETKGMENIVIYDSKKGKDILAGAISRGVFYKRVKPEKHFIRKLKAYGIQEEVFENLRMETVTHICIEQKNEPYEKLWANKETWLNKGFLRDLGHGTQRCLPVRYMKTEKT